LDSFLRSGEQRACPELREMILALVIWDKDAKIFWRGQSKFSLSKKDVCRMKVLPVNKFKTQYRRRNSTMANLNNNPLTDNQNEKIIDSLRNEILSLKSQLKKKDDRITSLDVMLNQIMGSHNSEVRAYEDLESNLEDLIDMLRKRVPHGDILDYLKVKDSGKLW
jgi:hypothetical protein